MEPIQRQLSSLLRESWQLIHARRVCNVDRSNPDGSGFGCKHLEMKDWPVERGIDRSNSVRAPLTYSFDLGSEWGVHMIGRSMPYRIAGIDVHKGMLLGSSPPSKSTGSTTLSGASWVVTRRNGDGWPSGGSNHRSEKWSWNRRRSIGNQGPSHVGNTAPGAGAIEPGTAGAQERLRRRRT